MSDRNFSSRFLAGVLVSGLVLIVATAIAVEATATLFQKFVVVSLLVTLVAFASIALEPIIYARLLDAEPVTGADATDLHTQCDAVGVDVDRIWVVEGNAPFGLLKLTGLSLTSLQLFVEPEFVSDTTPAEQRALLAWERSIVGSRHRLYQPVVVVPVVGAYALVAAVRESVPTADAGPGAYWFFLPEVGLLVALAVVLHQQRQKVYAADDEAVTETDVETFVGVVERTYSRISSAHLWQWLWALYWMAPTPERRLERLRSR